MDYEKLCKDVLAIDPKIRFSGIVNTKGILVNGMYQEGVEKLLSPGESQMSFHYSMHDWEKSKNLTHKMGNQKASIAEFDKVTLISIPLNNSDLFVASIEPNEDYFKMVLKIKPFLKNN